MKEVPLSDTPVDRLVAEAERTGETIVLTRDGKPAATLKAAPQFPSKEEREAAIKGLQELSASIAARGTEGWPTTWEEIKDWAEDGRGP